MSKSADSREVPKAFQPIEGIQPLLYSGIHGRGIQNPWKWNPESTEVESGIQSVESRIQDSLGLPYMGRTCDLKVRMAS